MAQDQRGTLSFRKRRQRVPELIAEPVLAQRVVWVSIADLPVRTRNAVSERLDLSVPGLPDKSGSTAQMVDAQIVGDTVQPGGERCNLRAPAVGLGPEPQQRFLVNVLDFGAAAQHSRDVATERGGVTLSQIAKCETVAGGNPTDEQGFFGANGRVQLAQAPPASMLRPGPIPLERADHGLTKHLTRADAIPGSW